MWGAQTRDARILGHSNRNSFKYCFGLEVAATAEPGHRVNEVLGVNWM